MKAREKRKRVKEKGGRAAWRLEATFYTYWLLQT